MTEHAAEKRVTWAELFFDLVFVVAVTRVSELLGSDHGWGGLLRALVVFVPVYWLWVGTAIQTNLQDMTRPLMQLRVLAIALAAVFMAIAVPEAYHDLGMVFAIAYWLGRIVIGSQLLYFAARARTLPVNPYTVSMFGTGPMLVLGATLHGDARLAVWGAAALIDLATPSLLRARLRGMHYDAGHLSERFGLFVLIALGESVVSVVTSTGPGDLDVAHGSAVAVAFVVSCGLWWVYFYFAADAMRYALATAKVQLDITRLVLSYGHLSFIAAIILVSVGLHESIAHPGEALSWGYAGLLVGGVALYLASFGFTRWAMFRLVSWTRLIAAAAVLVLLSVATQVPALAVLVAIAVILVTLNVVEYARVERIGWRALLARRPAPAGLAPTPER
ncbi:MAG TPA: low temperature requirement protein A [Jatrophihabitans sp.]|nr:low temperature requirement protein A [Jatrophihabitans sp.]